MHVCGKFCEVLINAEETISELWVRLKDLTIILYGSKKCDKIWDEA